MKATLFVSSAQKELKAERRAIKEHVQRDPLLRRFFEVFLFEDQPAADRRADNTYLTEVDRCGVFVSLLGNEYSSPTEREFDRATSKGKVRLIFIKGTDDKARHPKMRALIRKAGAQLIRRRFEHVPDLTAALYASLVDHLERQGVIQDRPCDARPCPDATVDDIDPDAVATFVRLARHKRKFPLPEQAPTLDVLAHLNLLDRGGPTNAAVLLFGRQPQRFLPTSEVKCVHFHGTEVRRPVPSYQVYKGTMFELVDQAVDFVMSKIACAVGTRSEGPRAPVKYELPKLAVGEAIVNAVAHRDYTSNASVQVSLFADRLEVWNPGELAPPLTPELLRMPHRSIPRNPSIAEPLFLAGYIEKLGTGTLMMIRWCREHGLPEPDFMPRPGEFGVTIWRDWLTEEVVAGANLNDRQRLALGRIKQTGGITSGEYQELTGAPPRTSTRDLEELVAKKLLVKVGKVGRGAHYAIRDKSAINRPNRPVRAVAKSALNRPNRPSATAPRKEAAKGPKGPSKARRTKGGKKGTKRT